MKVVISWWDLSKSNETIESLTASLNQSDLIKWSTVNGLHHKYWISDVDKNLWGAVMIWENEKAMQQSLPPNRAQQLIGYPPSYRNIFDIEAVSGQDG